MGSTARRSPFAGAVGTTLVIAVLFGVVVLQSHVHRVVSEPALSGATWDLTMTFEDGLRTREAERRVRSDPRVAASAIGSWLPLDVDGRRVLAVFVDTSSGVDIAVDRGRPPAAENEIALGAATMRDLGVRVGDDVEVRVPSDFAGTAMSPGSTLTVTGRSLLVAPIYEAIGQGGGAALTRQFVHDAGYTFSDIGLFVRLRDGADELAVAQQVAAAAGAAYWFRTADPSGVGVLRDIRNLPLALVALLGALALVTLLQRLVVGARATRRQLAVLRSLGFTGGQTSAAGAIHGLVVVVVTSGAAMVLGVAAARPSWDWIAEYLGVVPSSVVPVTALVAAAAAATVASVGAGVLVAAPMRNAPPARDLRTE